MYKCRGPSWLAELEQLLWSWRVSITDILTTQTCHSQARGQPHVHMCSTTHDMDTYSSPSLFFITHRVEPGNEGADLVFLLGLYCALWASNVSWCRNKMPLVVLVTTCSTWLDTSLRVSPRQIMVVLECYESSYVPSINKYSGKALVLHNKMWQSWVEKHSVKQL